MMDDKRELNIIGKTKLWFMISGTVIGVGIIFMIINLMSPHLNYERNYPLKLGIDFTGGTVFKLVYNLDYDTEVTDTEGLVAELHDVVSALSVTEPLVQAGKNKAGNLVIQVRTDDTVKDKETELKAKILEIVTRIKPDAELTDEDIAFVGPVIGRELAYRGITGLLIGGLLILLYVGVRMSFDFAVCAIIALFHDVLVLCGIFAIIRVEIDSSFVAAILTVVGYSINDTIVIFDRVRENMGLKKGVSFEKIVNFSLVQTLPRSINTSLTTMFPLLSLLLFGGPTIKNFALALLVGVISGTYSSICNASPILVVWRQKKKMKALAVKELAHGTPTSPSAPKIGKPAKILDDIGPEEALEKLEADDPEAKSTYGTGKTGAKKKKKRKR